MPPQDRTHANNCNSDQHDKQGRILDPGNRRNSQGHEQAEKKYLPREHIGRDLRVLLDVRSWVILRDQVLEMRNGRLQWPRGARKPDGNAHLPPAGAR
jgi:hypothetical protein